MTMGRLARHVAELLARAPTVLATDGADHQRSRATWTARRGEQIHLSMPRRAQLPMQLAHAIHHRGQRSVSLRLNEIPVPGMDGPSVDGA